MAQRPGTMEGPLLISPSNFLNMRGKTVRKIIVRFRGTLKFRTIVEQSWPYLLKSFSEAKELTGQSGTSSTPHLERRTLQSL